MAHIHSVFDSNEHFVIDPVTRAIANSLAKKIVVMQFDHNSERFTFEIPNVDGHNMANCDRVEIHYINVDAVDKTLKSTGVYEVKDIKPSPGDNSVAVFSWLLSRNCTKYAGTLSFLIHFACTTDGVEDYAWNTAIFQSITIGNGMNNGAEVLEPFPDILAQWQAQLFSASETAVLNVTTAEANALAAIEAAGEAKKQSVLDSIPDEYEALSALADQNHRNKAGAIVLDAEGESIVVNDASEYPLQNLKVFGKSTQDGTPTPDAPVDIVSVENPTVAVYGKNLCNMNAFNSMGSNGTSNTYNSATNTITMNADAISISGRYGSPVKNLPVGRECTVSFDIKGTPGRIVKCGWDKKKTAITLTDTFTRYSSTLAITTKTEPVSFYTELASLGGLRSGEYMQFANVQIEYGKTATEHEEYKTAQAFPCILPNGLPGIPVSSGGNYTDANGQQWICDEVDLARGVYVQRIIKQTITDFGKSSNYLQSGGFTEGNIWLQANVLYETGLCDRFVYAANGNKERFAALGSGAVYFVVSGELTLEEWRTKMTELAPTIMLALKTPIETPLSEAEISAFKALHSNRPNTTILNDAGAHMAVSYVADTKTYIDNKIAEMMKGVVE